MRRVIKKEPRRLTVRVPQEKKAQTFLAIKLEMRNLKRAPKAPPMQIKR